MCYNDAAIVVMVSRVSAKSGESWRLAGAMTIARGMPQASTAIERLMPRFPRSTGLLPAFSPLVAASQANSLLPIGAASNSGKPKAGGATAKAKTN